MKDFQGVKYVLLVLFAGVIVLSFVTKKPVPRFGDEFRIFYYHVPSAIICFWAFAVNLFYSIKYLRDRSPLDDLRAAAAAELGLVFGILATLTGSIFARIAWGAFWNWDIRQTSIVVLLAVYGAYFALRGAVEPEERRSSFSAVYSLLAFLAVPTFGFLVPRLYKSLHPTDTIISQGKIALGPTVAVVFFGSILSFGVLFWWLFNLRWRSMQVERLQMEKGYE